MIWHIKTRNELLMNEPPQMSVVFTGCFQKLELKIESFVFHCSHIVALAEGYVQICHQWKGSAFENKKQTFCWLNGDHGSTTQSHFRGPTEKIKHFKNQEIYLF